MKIEKKQPVIEAFEFTGNNYDELKLHFPELKKYTHRDEHDYTVGWDTFLEFEGQPIKSWTEALPGFWLVIEDENKFILEPEEFQKRYQ